jgi:hypothetical protein
MALDILPAPLSGKLGVKRVSAGAKMHQQSPDSPVAPE